MYVQPLLALSQRACLAINKSGILNNIYKPLIDGPHSAKNEGAHVWLKAFQATMSLLNLGTVALPALTL